MHVEAFFIHPKLNLRSVFKLPILEFCGKTNTIRLLPGAVLFYTHANGDRTGKFFFACNTYFLYQNVLSHVSSLSFSQKLKSFMFRSWNFEFIVRCFGRDVIVTWYFIALIAWYVLNEFTNLFRCFCQHNIHKNCMQSIHM